MFIFVFYLLDYTDQWKITQYDTTCYCLTIFFFASLILTCEIAGQVLGLLIEVVKKGFHKHIDRVLPMSFRILQSAIDAVTNSQVGFSAETTVPFWKEAYYSLVMLEKMIHQFHDLCFAQDLEVSSFVK